MQKVEGSNPFSRFEEGLHLQVFSLRQSPCSSAPGRTDSGLATSRSSAASRKRPICRQFSVIRTEVILQAPAAGRAFVCCGRWPAVPANGTFLRTDLVPARWPAIHPRGESDFSPDTVRPTLGPASGDLVLGRAPAHGPELVGAGPGREQESADRAGYGQQYAARFPLVRSPLGCVGAERCRSVRWWPPAPLPPMSRCG